MLMIMKGKLDILVSDRREELNEAEGDYKVLIVGATSLVGCGHIEDLIKCKEVIYHKAPGGGYSPEYGVLVCNQSGTARFYPDENMHVALEFLRLRSNGNESNCLQFNGLDDERVVYDIINDTPVKQESNCLAQSVSLTYEFQTVTALHISEFIATDMDVQEMVIRDHLDKSYESDYFLFVYGVGIAPITDFDSYIKELMKFKVGAIRTDDSLEVSGYPVGHIERSDHGVIITLHSDLHLLLARSGVFGIVYDIVDNVGDGYLGFEREGITYRVDEDLKSTIPNLIERIQLFGLDATIMSSGLVREVVDDNLSIINIAHESGLERIEIRRRPSQLTIDKVYRPSFKFKDCIQYQYRIAGVNVGFIDAIPFKLPEGYDVRNLITDLFNAVYLNRYELSLNGRNEMVKCPITGCVPFITKDVLAMVGLITKFKNHDLQTSMFTKGDTRYGYHLLDIKGKRVKHEFATVLKDGVITFYFK